VSSGTPDYGLSDHAEIVGYFGSDEKWHEKSDADWSPPDFDDMEYSEQYVIQLHKEGWDTPENMPDFVTWNGLMDEFVDLDDIADYYASHYEELAG
jgi:hypothetical protein